MAYNAPIHKLPAELHLMVARFAASALDCANLRQCAKWVHPGVLEEAAEKLTSLPALLEAAMHIPRAPHQNRLAFDRAHLYGEGEIWVKERLANKMLIRCRRLEEEQRHIEAFYAVWNRFPSGGLLPVVQEVDLFAGDGMLLWTLLLEAISPRVQSIRVGFERGVVLPDKISDFPALNQLTACAHVLDWVDWDEPTLYTQICEAAPHLTYTRYNIVPDATLQAAFHSSQMEEVHIRGHEGPLLTMWGAVRWCRNFAPRTMSIVVRGTGFDGVAPAVPIEALPTSLERISLLSDSPVVATSVHLRRFCINRTNLVVLHFSTAPRHNERILGMKLEDLAVLARELTGLAELSYPISDWDCPQNRVLKPFNSLVRLNVGHYKVPQIQWASTASWLAQLLHPDTGLHSSPDILKTLAFVQTTDLNRSWLAVQRLAARVRVR